MKMTGTKGAAETHQGDPDSIERAYYRLPADQRHGATIEVMQAQADALMQHPRSDVVFKTFMGCVLKIVDAPADANQPGSE